MEGKVEEKGKFLEEKEKALEEKVKLVGDQEKAITELKQSLEAERDRLKDLISKMVTLEQEKSTMAIKHKEEIKKISDYAEKMRKAVEDKDGELIMMKCDMARAAIQITAQAKEIESVNLKKAELTTQIDKAQKLAGDYAVRMAGAAQVYVTLKQKESAIATAKAELEASQSFLNFTLHEERKVICAQIEAELDARFKAVEPLERLMASVVEREKQCKYLLEEISLKTAEVELSQEHIFADKAERMLHAVYNKCEELCQSISGKAMTTTPGSLDDAKKGEIIEKITDEARREGGERVGVEERIEAGSLIQGGSGAREGSSVGGEVAAEEQMGDEARAELARKKGKDKVLEEPRKPSSGKLLASSMASHPAIVAPLTKEQRERQIAEDEALARVLKKEFELPQKALIESLQAGASGAPDSIAAPASTLALASTTVGVASANQAITPSAPAKKKYMPPPPAPKQPLKRTSPETRGDDPASKRQKIK